MRLRPAAFVAAATTALTTVAAPIAAAHAGATSSSTKASAHHSFTTVKAPGSARAVFRATKPSGVAAHVSAPSGFNVKTAGRAGWTTYQLSSGKFYATTSNVTTGTTINVTYTGFSASARTAFQAAVDVWKTQIVSSVPININADWTPLGTGILGSAGPSEFGQDNNGVLYPKALADSLNGSDIDPGVEDIDAQFSSAFSNWYFGTDGNTPGSDYDLMSVVLHELGHGLGFFGGADYNSTTQVGYVGLTNDNVTFYPTIFDTFVYGNGQPILNYTEGSTTLGSVLTGGNVKWNGTNGKAAYGGQQPVLYAPSTWQDGSSYSHLDESTYPGEDANALMTYAIAAGEFVHNPGPIMRGMFADMGWTVVNPPGTPTAVSATPGAGSATVSWTAPASNGGAAISRYDVAVYPHGSATQIGTVSTSATSTVVNGLSAGSSYDFTVAAVNAAGSSTPSAPVTAAITTAAPAGDHFVPLPTKRIVGPLAVVAGTPKTITVQNVAGLPASGVDAVVVNIEVSAPTKAGYVRVVPAGQNSQTAVQEFVAGQTISNLVTVKANNGQIQVSLSAGSANIFADVEGYYTAGSGDTFMPLPTARIYTSSALKAGTDQLVNVTNVGGLPATGVDGVLVNVEISAPTSAGYVRVVPAGQNSQTAVQEFTKGQTISNLVAVKASNGKIQLHLSAGQAAVFVDVAGYFTAGSGGKLFHPLATVRIDGPTKVASSSDYLLAVLGKGGLPITGVDSVVANFEVSAPTSAGYLRVVPSDVNSQTAVQEFTKGQTISNLATVKPGSADNKLREHLSAGSATTFADVAGYYASY